MSYLNRKKIQSKILIIAFVSKIRDSDFLKIENLGLLKAKYENCIRPQGWTEISLRLIIYFKMATASS